MTRKARIALLAIVFLAPALAAPAWARPCACTEICGFVECSTECCTPSGTWDTCYNWDPACGWNQSAEPTTKEELLASLAGKPVERACPSAEATSEVSLRQ